MNLILQNLPDFLSGARNTLIYCVVSFPLALLIGLILALMKSSHFAWVNMPAKIFIEVVRSTPIITQLFLVYYGLGAVLANYNTPGQNFFRVVLPQAVPLMIPPFVNDIIYMLKDSAIVSVISGTELTSVLRLAVFRHPSNTFPFFALALVLYLLLSLPTSYVARFFERRLRAAL